MTPFDAAAHTSQIALFVTLLGLASACAILAIRTFASLSPTGRAALVWIFCVDFSLTVLSLGGFYYFHSVEPTQQKPVPYVASTLAQPPQKPVYLRIGKEQLVIGETTINDAALLDYIASSTAGRKDPPIFIRVSDDSVSYNRVGNIIGILQSAGYNHIKIVAAETRAR